MSVRSLDGALHHGRAGRFHGSTCWARLMRRNVATKWPQPMGSVLPARRSCAKWPTRGKASTAVSGSGRKRPERRGRKNPGFSTRKTRVFRCVFRVENATPPDRRQVRPHQGRAPNPAHRRPPTSLPRSVAGCRSTAARSGPARGEAPPHLQPLRRTSNAD